MRPPFSPDSLDWLRGHAIDPMIATETGVREDRRRLLFPIVTRLGVRFTRTRLLPGPCLQPKGVKLAPWWITGHDSAQHVLILEGEGDGLAALTARVKSPKHSTVHRLAIVALPGAGVAHDVLLEDLIFHGVKVAAIALDGDQAGRSATCKLGDRITAASIRALTIDLPDGLDLADLLASSHDPVLTFSEVISEAKNFTPNNPSGPTRELAVRPRIVSDNGHRDAFERSLLALREIRAELYLATLVPESNPTRGICRCPLPNDHEDRRPSASYKGTAWYCHRCGIGGGLFTLAAAITGRATTGPDFIEVVNWAAKHFNLETAAFERLDHERRAA